MDSWHWSWKPTATGVIIGAAGLFFGVWSKKQIDTNILLPRERPGLGRVNSKTVRQGQDPLELARKLSKVMSQTTFYETLRNITAYLPQSAALRSCNLLNEDDFDELLEKLNQELKNKSTKWSGRVSRVMSKLSSPDRIGALPIARDALAKFDQTVFLCAFHTLGLVAHAALKHADALSSVKRYFEKKLEDERKYRLLGKFAASVKSYQKREDLEKRIKDLQDMQNRSINFAGDTKSRAEELWVSWQELSRTDDKPYGLSSLHVLLAETKKYLDKIEHSTVPRIVGAGDSQNFDELNNMNILQLTQEILFQLKAVQAAGLRADMSIGNFFHRHRRAIVGLSAAALASAFTLSCVLPSLGITVTEAVSTVLESVGNFSYEHVIRPVNNTRELLLEERVHSVGNVAELKRSRVELRTMLEDYVQKTLLKDGQLTFEQRDELLKLARAGDVGVVESQLAAETGHPIWNAIFGNLVQLLLIDVESAKVRPLVATTHKPADPH